MTEGPKGGFDNWVEEKEELVVPDKEKPIAPPDDSEGEQQEVDSEGKIKKWSEWLNGFVLSLGYAWDMKDLGYLKDQGGKAIGKGFDKTKDVVGSAIGKGFDKTKDVAGSAKGKAGDQIKKGAKGAIKGVQKTPRKTGEYWRYLLPLIPVACFAVWQIRGLGKGIDSGSWLDSFQKAGEVSGEAVSGPMSLPEVLNYAVTNENGTLGEFRKGLIHLNFLHPWNDRSMWKVVAGGGALAPFIEERDAYIDAIFSTDTDKVDVKTDGSMTKNELEALLWSAEGKGLMTEDDVLFYLVRWQYGDDAAGFYELLEKGPEALRKLQFNNQRPHGRSGVDLPKRGEIDRDRQQKNEMQVMARQAKQQRWG